MCPANGYITGCRAGDTTLFEDVEKRKKNALIDF